MTFHSAVYSQILATLNRPQVDEGTRLNEGLRYLSKWRSTLIHNTLVQKNGTVVLDGPFAGLDFLDKSAEGCHTPKLLGCYEQPLWPQIRQAMTQNYKRILNIGCAEGYYAVGMARQMHNAHVFAHDLNPKAQQVCRELALKNGVAERVSVGGLFNPHDFESHAHEKTLVLCDIEGGEQQLLDPKDAQVLERMDLIVESHECLIPGITQLLVNRFSATHEIILVEDNGQRQLSNAPAWFKALSHLDQLLAVWEWRSGPTPWLVFKSKLNA